MAAPQLPADVAKALTDPKAYGEWNGLHDKFAWARANAPLAVAEVPEDEAAAAKKK